MRDNEKRAGQHWREGIFQLTIDERIQAIAMHLEILSHMHQASEKNHEDLAKKHEDLANVHADFVKKMTQYSADVKDAIARLANIAAVHDETLDNHDKRIEDLEK